MSFIRFPSTSVLDLRSLNITITSEESFTQLETEYNKMLGQMEDNPKLVKYLDAYSNLFDYLYAQHVNSTELMNAKRSLEEKIQESTLQLEANLQTIKSNEILIVSMRKDIQHSRMEIDEVHFREQSSQEIIDNLRRNILNLQKEIAFKQKMTFVDTDESATVVKHKQGIVRENAELAKEVNKLNEALQEALNYQEELELQTDYTEMQILEICTKLEDVTEEFDISKHTKSKLETALENKRVALEDLLEEEEQIELINQEEQLLITQLEDEMKKLFDRTDKCMAKYEACGTKASRLQQNFNKQAHEVKIIAAELGICDNNLKTELRAHIKIKQDLESLNQQKAYDNNFVDQLVAQDSRDRKDLETLRNEIAELENLLSVQKADADNDRRQIVNYSREMNVIRKKISVVAKMGGALLGSIDLHERERMKRELEVEFHDLEMQKQMKHVNYLERERDRYTDENQENAAKIQTLLQQLRLKKIQIFDQKKLKVQHRNKMRQLINMYDETRSSSVLLKKSLKLNYVSTKNLNQDITKFYWLNKVVLSHIQDKEHLAKESKRNTHKIAKEKDELQEALTEALQYIRNLKVEISAKTVDIKTLHGGILVQDRHLRQKISEIETLVNEREILGQQIDRRNKELYLLYQKIAILWTASKSGEDAYTLRLNDIGLLQYEITRLGQKKQALTDDANNMNDLKIEVFHLEVDLRRERLKSKVMEEELKGTTNVHRWRKLEASNPEVYTLLKHIRLLQKHVLGQTKQVDNLKNMIMHVKKLAGNMQQIIAKLPNPEFKTRMNKDQNKLHISKNQEKSLLFERQSKEIQNDRVHLELHEGTLDIWQEKRKLLKTRKKRQKDLKRLHELKQNVTSAFISMEKMGLKPSINSERTKLPMI